MRLIVTAFDAFAGMGSNSTRIVADELGRSFPSTVDCALAMGRRSHGGP